MGGVSQTYGNHPRKFGRLFQFSLSITEEWVSGRNRLPAKEVTIIGPEVRILPPPQKESLNKSLPLYCRTGRNNNYTTALCYFNDIWRDFPYCGDTPILHAPFPNIRKGLFRTGMSSIGSVFLLFKTKISNFAEKKEMVWILGIMKFLFAAGGLFFTWLLITNLISAVTNPDFEERDGKLIEKGANARSALILITSVCWGLVIALP